MKISFSQFSKSLYILLFIIGLLLASNGYSFFQIKNLTQTLTQQKQKEAKLNTQIASVGKELLALKTEDQYVINQKNSEEIKSIQDTYTKTVGVYEALLELKVKQKTDKLDDLYATTLSSLAEKKYASAQASLANLEKQIKEENTKIATNFKIPENITTNNAAPTSGFAKQQVATDIGSFLVDIVSGDLGTTRVIVDTASDGDCRDNCPVLSLGDYVARNGAFAGINGSYFCPASYPSCAGKTNSFDTLLMNKNKKYFNSDNNVYSTVPAVVFLGNSVRFVGRSLDWGRDTGIDSMIANQPLLVSGGNVVFGGDGDPKKGSKGPRSFVANKGTTVYIGVVHNATVAEAAHALKTLGMENGLNLDSGGSTALWNGGYKVGPGRNIPNAILFVRK